MPSRAFRPRPVRAPPAPSAASLATSASWCCRRVLRAAAADPLRRVPAGRGASRRHRALAVGADRPAGRDRRASSPAGTAGIRSCRSAASASAIARARTAPLLELPRVDLIVAWTSLPLLDLRLKELLIEGPRLAIRRDAAGPVPRRRHRDRSRDRRRRFRASPTGCCASREIVVRDALVTWNDELPQRARSWCSTTSQFRLEQRFGHHRFGLTGVPPTELAAPLDAARRRDRRFARRTGSKLQGQALRAPRLRRRRRVARVAAAAVAGRERQGRAARCGSISPTAQPRDVTADLELADVARNARRRAAAAVARAPRRPRRVASATGAHSELYTRSS